MNTKDKKRINFLARFIGRTAHNKLETIDKLKLMDDGELAKDINIIKNSVYIIEDFAKQIKEITEKDFKKNDKCDLCGSKEKLTFHNERYNKRMKKFEEELTLCKKCYRKIYLGELKFEFINQGEKETKKVCLDEEGYNKVLEMCKGLSKKWKMKK